MKNLISALILVASSFVAGQRPSFAGLSPIGYPPTPNRTTTTPDPLADRFGETEVLPIEANGDRDLIDRLSKLPIDKQPFWFINWQAYDKHRKGPQTFQQRPSAFVDNIPSNSGQGNNGFSTPNPAVIATQPNVISDRFASVTASSQLGDASRNVNNNANVNDGRIVYPTSNINPIAHILPTTNVYDNSNLYTSSNSNSNSYPNSNSNSNTYPDRNSNWSVSPTGNPTSNTYPNNYPVTNVNPNTYPSGNVNPNTYPPGNVNPNNYPTGNVNPNNYPTGNVNPNYYPTGNVNPNNYPTSNVNPNNYPTGNVNPNNYPSGNVNPNNYPTGNTNSNQYQASSFNSSSNTGNQNSTFTQTTQKYQWTSTLKTTKVVPSNFNNYPGSYPRTESSSQILPGHDSYYNY